jgi:hypothetical protein
VFRSADAKLYERLLKEKDRQVEILADQIDYLRAQLAIRGTFVPGAAANPSEQPERDAPAAPYLMEVKNHVSDEELDAEAIAHSEGLNEAQMREVVEALGLVPEIDLDNITFS